MTDEEFDKKMAILYLEHKRVHQLAHLIESMIDKKDPNASINAWWIIKTLEDLSHELREDYEFVSELETMYNRAKDELDKLLKKEDTYDLASDIMAMHKMGKDVLSEDKEYNLASEIMAMELKK